LIAFEVEDRGHGSDQNQENQQGRFQPKKTTAWLDYFVGSGRQRTHQRTLA
jgi:hypothetical protein